MIKSTVLVLLVSMTAVAGAQSKGKAAVSKRAKPAPSPYFVIQNVATEQTRVYERCTITPDCPHRMVMETETVVGRSEGEKKDPHRFITWLGRYKLISWKKFYQDNEAHYPSWYHPEYPPIPLKPDPKDWFSKKLLPNGDGNARGAFGWYAAMIAPNANQQWIHGTYGWGWEEDRYIRYTRGFWINVFSDPRSAGCTRLENRAVAYLRHLVPAGTEILRVYAKEGLRDPTRTAYLEQASPAAWDWILTTEGFQQEGPSADKNTVLANNVQLASIIEQGTYGVDGYPDARGIMPRKSARSGLSGNTYKIDETEFQGVYLVDEGRFVGYRHPSKLPRGGYEDTDLPEVFRTTGEFVLATRGPEKLAPGETEEGNDPRFQHSDF